MPVTVSGRPTVRRAQLPGGNRKAQEANAGGPKGNGKPGRDDRPLRRLSRITGRIRVIARTRKGADVGLVSL